MPTDLPPPTVVTDPRGLRELLADLAGCEQVAVDTEADSFFSYREKVCLIQVTAGERDYLVDPLADFDLAPLGELFEDPGREKVFHDGEYDVLILKRDHGFTFRNLFDTRVAASALGVQAPGLAAVLESRFGVRLDKSMQRSDWSARPLSERQIDYARLDTHFLASLANEQKAELDARGLRRVVDGECERLEQLVPPDTAFQPDEWVRIQGARKLPPEARSAARELFALRDRLAARANLPPFKIFGNPTLIELAQRSPNDLAGLERVHGFSARQARRNGEDVLAALERARAAGPIERLPVLPPRDGTGDLDDAGRELHERLKAWRRDRAKKLGYDASLVLNRHVLLRLARVRPTDRAGLESVDGLLDWQRDEFGEELARLLKRSLDEFARDGVPQGKRKGRNRGR